MNRKREIAWRMTVFAIVCSSFFLPGKTSAAQTSAPSSASAPEVGGDSSSTLDPCPSSPKEAEVLSEVGNVNLDLYLKRLTYRIRSNWYSLVPEEAWLKVRGRVVLDISIKKDGSLKQTAILCSSGDEALNTAAEVSLKLSSPFPPLPEPLVQEFEKQKQPIILKVRLCFFYNPAIPKATPHRHKLF